MSSTAPPGPGPGDQPRTTVERALATALYAEGAGARADGRGGKTGKAGARKAGSSAVDAAIDTAASLLAADPGADAELSRRGEEFVRRAWERGWQPADVVRLVRRDLGDQHVRIVAELVRTEARRYPAAGLPPRWAAQLGDLAAGAVPPWRAPDRFSYGTAVLELYRLLLRLPSIEPVGPVPGTVSGGLRGAAVTAAAAVPPSAYEPKALTRIRALLAKAEATDYPEEAEALSAKAQELAARYSVDAAALSGAGGDAAGRAVPGACRIGVEPPYETAKAILLDAVAGANRCRAVWNGEFDFSTVVGYTADLDAVELLYTSLLVQGTAAMTRAEAAQRAGGRRRTKTFRQSFLMAYAARVGERLTAAADAVTGAAPADLLPVLATREVAVAARADELFPRTTTTRVRGVDDTAGWNEGRAAADSARVGPDRPPLRGPDRERE
ncbi:DUF2786 domain-containing protein [Streptomyces sp. NPDC006798]|uniref:DUF2786 domain-containing protein n=1 Tax=Streptomyces sp. NPDC006798 TaxID=3155462 RepID=UPI0033D7D106